MSAVWHWVKVVTATSTNVCENISALFSTTVQRNCIKFGSLITPDSDSFSLTLHHCSSFSFGIANVYNHQISSPFKRTVDIKLETLITPHLKVLCN